METPNGATNGQSAPKSSASSSISDIPKLEVENIPVESVQDVQQSAVPDIPDTGYLPLQDYLGIKTAEDDDKHMMQFIWDSFAKGRDRVETLEAIKEAQSRLSQPEIGERNLTKLYNYTRLIEEGRNIEKEKRVYEG